MPQLSIESNGFIEKTAVYYNGEQLSGIKDLFVEMDEEGTFNAVIQYVGTDDKLYTKQVFTDDLIAIKTSDPLYSDEEAMDLQSLDIESDGYIDNTDLWLNEEGLEGVVSLFVHIKAPKTTSGTLSTLFKKSVDNSEVVCKCEITFRNEDESIETEDIF